ncbi:MAG: hypothetical protein COA47_15535 [Robiginitomaculum sp.]|nr:MAG: hypothetical protein COA47_15535 [Robiginitomaculum sp.]
MNNILFIDSYYDCKYGAQKSMLSLAHGLSLEQVDVTVGSCKDGILLKSASDMNLDVINLETPEVLLKTRSEMKSFFYFFRYFITLLCYWYDQVKYNKLSKYNSICINDIRSFLYLLPTLIKFKGNVIWYVRINDRVPFITSIAGWITNKIVLISNDCINVFNVIEKKCFKDKIVTLHTGFEFNDVDESLVSTLNKKYNPQQDKIIYISVGSICQRKNQASIIDAFYKLNSLDVLILIGSPTTQSDYEYYLLLKKKCELLDVSHQVHFVDYTNNVLEYLSISDVFCLASKAEGLPRVLIEALYAGCFICTSNVDGVNDIIIDTKLGLISNHKASEESFDSDFLKILELSKINLNCKSHSHYRREYVQNKFSFDKFIFEFKNIFKYK